jgi:hypothetical protein
MILSSAAAGRAHPAWSAAIFFGSADHAEL